MQSSSTPLRSWLVQLSKKLLLIINTAKLIDPVIEKAFTHTKHYISLQDTCQCHLAVFSKIFIIHYLLWMRGLERKRQISARMIFGREVEMAKTARGKHNADCLKNYEVDWSGFQKSCRSYQTLRSWLVRLSKKLLLITNTVKLISLVIEKAVTHNKHCEAYWSSYRKSCYS